MAPTETSLLKETVKDECVAWFSYTRLEAEVKMEKPLKYKAEQTYVVFTTPKGIPFYQSGKWERHFKMHSVPPIERKARFSSAVHLNSIIHLSNW